MQLRGKFFGCCVLLRNDNDNWLVWMTDGAELITRPTTTVSRTYEPSWLYSGAKSSMLLLLRSRGIHFTTCQDHFLLSEYLLGRFILIIPSDSHLLSVAFQFSPLNSTSIFVLALARYYERGKIQHKSCSHKPSDKPISSHCSSTHPSRDLEGHAALREWRLWHH